MKNSTRSTQSASKRVSGLAKRTNAKVVSTPQLVVGLRPSRANTAGNNPKDRYGLAKVPYSLIPSTALTFMALGLGNGAKKYGPFNWRVEPVQGRIYLEAALRHLLLLLDGEDFDRDTGIHHGAFVLSTMAIYLDAMVHGSNIDNRAVAGRNGDLVAAFNLLPGQERTPAEWEQSLRTVASSFFNPTPTTKLAVRRSKRRA